MKKTGIVFLLLVISVYCYSDEPEPPIERIRNILSLRTNASYNFMYYNNDSLENALYSNRPLSIGFGLGIFGIAMDFSFSVPVYDREFAKTQSFDFSINNFARDNRFSSLYFKYYDGFNDRHEDIDLQMLEAGFSITFIVNNDHSIRSVYNLDRKQNVSNGSFLAGGVMAYSSIVSKSDLLTEYSARTNSFSFGPHFGYSYIFVFPNSTFINVLSTFGINGVALKDSFTFEFQALPKFAFGYHGRRIATNIVVNFNYYTGILNDLRYEIIIGSIGINLIYRVFQRKNAPA